MCSNSSTSMTAIRRMPRRMRSREKSRRREVRKVGAEIEMMNLKLYLENKCIMAENELLRERALLLCQENKALHSQFQRILLQAPPSAGQ